MNMNVKSIITGVFLLATATTVSAKSPDRAFKDGETLNYMVSYRATLIPNTDVAEVVLKTTRTTLDGEPVWNIYGNGRVMPFFRWFFDLNDTYNTWLDTKTLRPIKFTGNIEEGKYRFVSAYRYDWDSLKVHTTYRNLKHEHDSHKTMPLTNRSFDALALFYNLRGEDIESFKPGEQRYLELVLEDTIRRIQYRYLGKETKNIKGLGKFKTLKFSCQLATSSGESFEDGSEFFLWITDDRNKIPLYIESPIRVGSIRGKLAGYSNLRYELSSKIK